MAKLIYTNSRGDSIELGQSAPFFVTKIEGFSNVANIISTTKSPNQDGRFIRNESLDSRFLYIQGEYYYPNRQDGRDRLIQVFNPKLDGVLQYINGDFVREIECKPEGTPIISSTNKSTVPYMINLIAPIPFWLDEYESSEEIVTWIGGFRFPFRFPVRFGTRGDTIINILNEGDVDTPIKLEIMGPATKPKILLRETGEFIRVNTNLGAEDILIVTTEFGNKRVELNGVNAFNLIDLPDSTFFNLKTGDNVIVATTENINDNVKIKISYRNRYIGV